MIFQILAIIIVPIVTYFVFMTARDNGRNAVKWALATLGVGFGVQFILPVILVLIVGGIMLATGTRSDQLQAALQVPTQIVTYVCLALSLVGVFLVLMRVSKHPEPKTEALPPPATPTAGQNE